MTDHNIDELKDALRAYGEGLNKHLPQEVEVNKILEVGNPFDVVVIVDDDVVITSGAGLGGRFLYFSPHVSKCAEKKLADIIMTATDKVTEDKRRDLTERAGKLDAILDEITKEPTT